MDNKKIPKTASELELETLEATLDEPGTDHVGTSLDDRPKELNPLHDDNDDDIDDGASKALLDPESLRAFVKNKIATHLEAPTNFHQVTVYTVLHDKNATTSQKRWALAQSFAIVIFQILTACSLLLNTVAPSCSNDSIFPSACQTGYFCNSRYFFDSTCVPCHNAVHISKFTSFDQKRRYVASSVDGYGCNERGKCNGKKSSQDDLNFASMCEMFYQDSSYFRSIPAFAGGEEWITSTSREHWGDQPPSKIHDSSIDSIELACTQCQGADGKTYLDTTTVAITNVWGMRKLDFAMLILCVFLSSMFMGSEKRDINLSYMLMDQDMEVQNNPEPVPVVYRSLLAAIMVLRQYPFCLLMLCSLPFVVVLGSTNAASIAGNTISILFLLEVDNAVYFFGTSESTRVKMEQYGKVKMSRDDQEHLARSKHVFTGCFFVIMMVSINLSLVLRSKDWCHIFSIAGVVLTNVIDQLMRPKYKDEETNWTDTFAFLWGLKPCQGPQRVIIRGKYKVLAYQIASGIMWGCPLMLGFAAVPMFLADIRGRILGIIFVLARNP